MRKRSFVDFKFEHPTCKLCDIKLNDDNATHDDTVCEDCSLDMNFVQTEVYSEA